MVIALAGVGSGVAVAHQPVVLLNSDTTAAKGPLVVDGTVSFAVRAAFNKSGEKKAFRAQFQEGDALEVQYLIVDKKPENTLKTKQLPSVVITGPGGFRLTMKINERTKFYEPYGRTNYLYLARNSAVAKAGIYNFVITARAKSAITLGVGEKEIPGEVVRGAYVAPTVSATPTPTPVVTPTPTPVVTPTPTPTPTPGGTDGTDGKDGKDGGDGKDGKDGKDGLPGLFSAASIVNSIFAPELFKSSATLGPEVNTLFGAFRRSQMQ